MENNDCQYCWRPTAIGGHNEGCPLAIGTPVAMAEWVRGYQYGWDDNLIHDWEYSEYIRRWPTFFLGYQAGKSAIDKLVDDAAQRNYSYHRGEY